MRLSADMGLMHLVEYTDWQRSKWHEWLWQQGDPVPKISVGPHGLGRVATMGHCINHIFSFEKRYVERLADKALTDPALIPSHTVEGLFRFAQQSREDRRQLLAMFPEFAWNEPKEPKKRKLLNYLVIAAPMKIVTHILVHKIRDWAQIATMFRPNGLQSAFTTFWRGLRWVARGA
jgi:uncharacterized damage-inducible protein DinB